MTRKATRPWSEVDEPDSSNSLTVGTCYKYDTLDNLVEVDQGSETRTYSYDALSRLGSESTPEGGTVSLYYTASGGSLCSGSPSAVCRRTDARGITTTYTYDALSRLTGKSYSNGDHSVSYFYDQTSYNGLTITNGLGRRTGMSDASGQTAWSYDVEGHILTEKRTLASVTKTLSYTYNIDGTFSQITYPSGNLVSYQYNAVGQATSAQASTFYYVNSASYAPQGALSNLSMPGATRNFYFNSRLELSGTYGKAGTNQVVNLSFSYFSGNNGNVSGITDSVNSNRSQVFTYDNLNRISTAQTTSTSGPDCWGQSFGYDRYGNLTTVNVTQCSAPMLSLTVNTNNQITNTGFTYDASGNMTGDGLYTYTWNAESQLTSANSVNYTYDGDRKRVQKSNGTLYWFDPSGNVLEETDLSGNLLHDYIYFGGKRIARQDGTGASSVYYLFQDHLGTALVMTDTSGNIQQQSVYYPFGGERVITNTVANHYKFTGLERDSESGLDHTLNRQYSSTLGRWLSPDPVRGCVMNPQNFDLYSYALNDPSTLTDPLGLQCSDLVNGVINCTSTASGSDTGPGSTLWDLEFGGGSDSPGQPLLYRGGGARGGGGGGGGGSGFSVCPGNGHLVFHPNVFASCMEAGGPVLPALFALCAASAVTCAAVIGPAIASGAGIPFAAAACAAAVGFCGVTVAILVGCAIDATDCEPTPVASGPPGAGPGGQREVRPGRRIQPRPPGWPPGR